MKLLHITFHKGCELEVQYAFEKLGHSLEVMHFDDGETTGGELYQINHLRAQKCWDKYKDYFNTFDGIITSDTCPTSRPFLQNNWPKLLIIWVCNRFDYAVEGDEIFYNLLRDIPNRKNVYIAGNTEFENIYSKQLRNVDIGDLIIKPIGKNLISEGSYKTHSLLDEDRYFVPVYENETKFMNLSEHLNQMGIRNNNGIRFQNHISNLLSYKGIICLPYAWSTITFFEVMQLGIIYFIPSISFLIQLSSFRGMKQGYWFQPPCNAELLKYSEWYCDEHKDLLVYFDSWEDLKVKIKSLDYQAQTDKILAYAKVHSIENMKKWETIFTDYSLIGSSTI